MPPKQQQDNVLSEPSQFTLSVVIICFFLSGFAALIYQTAWLRQFSIIFGTSELAVATILAAYMAGLGLGAKIAARFINRIKNPIIIYGILEGGIALSALAIPYMLKLSQFLFVLIIGGQLEPPASTGLMQTTYYLISTFIIIAIPTTFMGATLPLLSKNIVAKNKQVGPRVAYLYAFNTLGAVLGTLLTGFVLLPSLGLSGSISIAVISNFFIFIIIVVYSRLSKEGMSLSEPLTESSTKDTTLNRFHPILPIIFFSGTVSFLYEVLWTRMLSHILGGTIYAFAVMLGSFLAGIALGSALASQFSKSRESASQYFIIVQVAIAALSIIAYNWMSVSIPDNQEFTDLALFAAAIIFPSTLFIGSTFPLAVRILSQNANEAGQSTARVFSWNVFGAIFGALSAGYIIIPLLEFSGSIKLAVSLNLLLAVAAYFTAQEKRRILGGVVCAMFMLVLFAYNPMKPSAIINSSPFELSQNGKEVFYAVGRSATVLVKREKGIFVLKTNGLPEASIALKGAPPMRQSQKWLMALPALARPQAQNALVIGYGGGVAVENIPENILETDVIELEHEVIKANDYIGSKRANNPLAKPDINIIINDARNALALTKKNYDIIISQPSHPWTAGASHLYTKEFIALAKQRLKKDGVFLQWINASFINEDLLKSITATLKSEFSNIRLYEPEPLVLMFLASDSPLELEQELYEDNSYIKNHTAQFSKVGIHTVEDLLAALTMDNKALIKFAEGAVINTDNDNHMATKSHADGRGLTFKQLYEITEKYHPLLSPSYWTNDPKNDDINHVYISERQIAIGMSKKALDLAKVMKKSSDKFAIMGVGLQYHGKVEKAQQAFRGAAQADRYNDQVNFMFIRPYLATLAKNRAPLEVAQAAASISTPSAKAVINAWRYGLSQQWQKIAELDSVLGQTKSSDSWLPQATKIRLDWRLLQSSPADKEKLGREIMAIADEVLLFYPTPELFIQRATGAIYAKDDKAFIETISTMLGIIEQKLQQAEGEQFSLSASERSRIQSRLQGVKSHFDASQGLKDTPRGKEVYDNIGLILNTTDKL